jgi:hypothetical protein
MAQSKESALFKYFCTAFSEALFIMVPGEYERVLDHLKKLGMSEADAKRMPRRYWRQHCR